MTGPLKMTRNPSAEKLSAVEFKIMSCRAHGSRSTLGLASGQPGREVGRGILGHRPAILPGCVWEGGETVVRPARREAGLPLPAGLLAPRGRNPSPGPQLPQLGNEVADGRLCWRPGADLTGGGGDGRRSRSNLENFINDVFIVAVYFLFCRCLATHSCGVGFYL